jgi:hypothetical protein
MPTPGLSLVGFMDPYEAINHLAHTCVPANPDPIMLAAEAQAAQAALGAPTPNAGNPRISDIDPVHAAYFAQLVAQPNIAGYLTNTPGAAFKMVEIDPLLAFQYAIDEGRSHHHCGSLPAPPSVADLLPICLPLTQAAPTVKMNVQPNGVLLKTRDHNLKIMTGGVHGSILGAAVDVSLALVHVVRFNGRCYLHNGYHRALGARLAGATEVPCVFRDVLSAQEIGIATSGTFQIPLLESGNPPTLGHFTQGRAHWVQLRIFSRAIAVSWVEHSIAEE